MWKKKANSETTPGGCRKFCRQVTDYITEYTLTTSIHGIKYIGGERSTSEKLFWLVVVIVALTGAIMMTIDMYRRFLVSPIIVSFSNKDTSIYEIPFPATTICPETKILRDKLDLKEIMKKMHNDEILTDDEYDRYQVMLMICPDVPVAYQMYAGESINETFTETEKFYKIIDEITPSVEDSFHKCYLWGKEQNCSHLFVKTFSKEGVCFSFNILGRNQIFDDSVYIYENYSNVSMAAEEWDEELGYYETAGIDTYPVRALFSGADNGLKLTLHVDRKNIEPMCNLNKGFKVQLHNPIDVPQPYKQNFLVSLDTSVNAPINPNMVATSVQVKRFTPKGRGCFLQVEKQLKYFKVYSTENCYEECWTDYLLKKCGCVWFHQPRNHSTPICGPGRIHCSKKVATRFLHKKLVSELEQENGSPKSTICDCLPLCSTIQYKVVVSNSHWDWKSYYRLLGEDFYPVEEIEKSSMALVNIYFKSENFLKLYRNELFGIYDLIANFGGLLGLFTGVSVISVGEFVYYFTFRIACNKFLYGEWSGTGESS